MWALNFLPDIVFHLIFTAGIVGLIAGFIFGFLPFISVYKTPIQIISILLFAVGLWYEGGIAKDKEWKAKVSDLEIKLQKMQTRSAKVDIEVVTKVLTKKQIIREKGDTIIEYIDREIVKFDNSCPIPEKLIIAHNAAATNNPELLNVNSEVPTLDHNQLAKPRIKMPSKK